MGGLENNVAHSFAGCTSCTHGLNVGCRRQTDAGGTTVNSPLAGHSHEPWNATFKTQNRLGCVAGADSYTDVLRALNTIRVYDVAADSVADLLRCRATDERHRTRFRVQVYAHGAAAGQNAPRPYACQRWLTQTARAAGTISAQLAGFSGARRNRCMEPNVRTFC